MGPILNPRSWNAQGPQVLSDGERNTRKGCSEPNRPDQAGRIRNPRSENPVHHGCHIRPLGVVVIVAADEPAGLWRPKLQVECNTGFQMISIHETHIHRSVDQASRFSARNREHAQFTVGWNRAPKVDLQVFNPFGEVFERTESTAIPWRRLPALRVWRMRGAQTFVASKQTPCIPLRGPHRHVRSIPARRNKR